MHANALSLVTKFRLLFACVVFKSAAGADHHPNRIAVMKTLFFYNLSEFEFLNKEMLFKSVYVNMLMVEASQSSLSP